MLINRLKMISIILLTGFSVYGDFTIYLLNPWAKDSDRAKTPVYIQTGESGWYPGTKMTTDFGDWLMYTFKTTTTSSNDRIEFMSVIPSANDEYDKKTYYKGGTSQIFYKDIFTGHETATEVWLVVTDTTKPPQIQFTSPPCKVIRFFKPWDFGGAIIDIKNVGVFRMRGLGDYCGWLTCKYGDSSKTISVKFRNSLDSTLYGAAGIGDGTYIDLSTSFTKNDTVWVLGDAAGKPSVGSTFPGKLGDCGSIRLASKLRDIDTAHPGFNKDVCHSWVGDGVWSGLVEKRLGSDGKPVLSDTVQCLKSIDWFNTEHFDNGYTNEQCYNLTLHKNDEGLYEYDTSEFFPLDSFKFLDANNTVPNPNYNGGGHNISFSMETGAEFEYVKGQKFYFRGDDDVWVYIDSQLVVDLGGIHAPAEGSVDLDTLGLTPGKTYSFKLFFCERNCCGSSFRMVTSINLRTSSKLYFTDTTLAPGTKQYNVYEKVTQDNMACDASETVIDTVRATVEFFIDGPSFSGPTKLSAGNAYGGITVLPDYTGIIIDEPSITGLDPGEYIIHFYSTKDRMMDGAFTFTVTPKPKLKISVKSAAYFSDNGNGSVTRAEIFFTDSLSIRPDSIQFAWPSDQNKRVIRSGIVPDSANNKHITIHFTDPFPGGITAYSGSAQLGKAYFKDTTFTSNPLVVIPFSIADSVGPLIKSAVLVERIEPGNDTILLTFSEPVQYTTLTGESFNVIRDGKKITLTVLSAFPKGDTAVCVIKDQLENSPKATDSIALNSSGPVVDLFGNTAHPQNRPVPFSIRRIPGKVISAYYSDTDADGVVDRVSLVFNKKVSLTEIMASLYWTDGNKTGQLGPDRFTYKKDSSEIDVNVTGKFSRQSIQTDGEMMVFVESTIKQGGQTIPVADSAAAVMTGAELFPGNPENGTKPLDTLQCTFSESINDITCLNPLLFLRADKGKTTQYQVALNVLSNSGNRYVFTVSNYTGIEFPENSDSVWINDTCDVSDMVSNKQGNPKNHRVPLKVNTIPISYDVKVGPNPIHVSDPASMTVITIEPSFKLKQFVRFDVDLTIFDQLGNAVFKEHKESQNSPSLIVALKWNARNKRGRIAGSGTYLAIVKIKDFLRNTEEVTSINLGVTR